MNRYAEFDEFSARVKREMDKMMEHNSGMPTCVSCKYWVPGEDLIRKVSRGGPADDISLAEGVGTCHRFPPPLIERRVESVFPSAAVEDWCGEWAKRENSVMF